MLHLFVIYFIKKKDANLFYVSMFGKRINDSKRGIIRIKLHVIIHIHQTLKRHRTCTDSGFWIGLLLINDMLKVDRTINPFLHRFQQRVEEFITDSIESPVL